MTHPNPTQEILTEIGDERFRQLHEEGWSTNHDDCHELGELAAAAGCYALQTACNYPAPYPPDDWPWADEWWKQSTSRRDLVKAAALIVAEIERLDRVEDKQE